MPGRDTFRNQSSGTGRPNDLNNFSEYIISGHENHGQSSKTYKSNDRLSWNNCPCRRYYFTGVTTLRVMWMIRGAPQGIEIALTSEFRDFRSLNPSPASIFWKFSWFSNLFFMEPVAMDPYNFFASQRPAVILSRNEIQTPADTTISKLFQNPAFMVTKMMVKDWKPMD